LSVIADRTAFCLQLNGISFQTRNLIANSYYAKSPVPGLIFFFVSVTTILLLNSIPASAGKYHEVHVIYMLILIVCFTPMTLYLFKPTDRLPFFQLICLVYAIHYTLYPFYTIQHTVHFDYLKYPDLMKSATVTLFGMLALVIGYYWRPINLLLRFIPHMQLDWEPKSARKISLGFFIGGFVGLLGMKTGLDTSSAGQLINFLANFSIVGILAFYILQMRKQMPRPFSIMIWFFFVPAYLGLAISGGNSGPIASFGLAVIMTYIGEKKKIPWIVIVLSVMALFPFMYAKFEFRDQVWDAHSASVKQEGLGDAAENSAKFGKIAAQAVTADSEVIKFALQAIGIRLDISYMLAHVMDMTPRQVDYLYGTTYKDLIWKLVPRVILPDKPDPKLGQNFGHMYQILAIDDTTTSINFPQLVELYVNFGSIGVIVGMFIISQIYWIICYFMNGRHVGDWLAVFSVSIFTGLFRVESNFSLVVAGIIYHVILYYVVGFFIRTTKKSGAQPQVRRALNY